MAFTQPEVRKVAVELLINFARSLEGERARRNLSNDAFLELISVSSARYSGWQLGRGNPSLQTIVTIFDRLGWEEERLKRLLKVISQTAWMRGRVRVESNQNSHYNDFLRTGDPWAQCSVQSKE